MILAQRIGIGLVLVGLLACNGTEEKQQDEAPEATVAISVPDKDTFIEEADAVDVPLATHEKILSKKQGIDDDIENFQVKTFTYETENGQTTLVGYHAGDELVKLVYEGTGEHIAIEKSFYLYEGELIFMVELSRYEDSFEGPYYLEESSKYLDQGEVIRFTQRIHSADQSDALDLTQINAEDLTSSIDDTHKDADRTWSQLQSHQSALDSNWKAFINAKWIDIEDSKAGIEVAGGQWVQFYRQPNEPIRTPYDYALKQAPEGYLKLILDDGVEALEYAWVELSENQLILSYIGRGNSLVFRKEIAALEPLAGIPDEIDGCSCYFALEAAAFNRGDFIYFDDTEQFAFINLNGELLKFTLDPESVVETDEDRFERTYGLGDYSLHISGITTTRGMSTFKQKGTIALKQHGILLYETAVTGECGC